MKFYMCEVACYFNRNQFCMKSGHDCELGAWEEVVEKVENACDYDALMED